MKKKTQTKNLNTTLGKRHTYICIILFLKEEELI